MTKIKGPLAWDGLALGLELSDEDLQALIGAIIRNFRRVICNVDFIVDGIAKSNPYPALLIRLLDYLDHRGSEPITYGDVVALDAALLITQPSEVRDALRVKLWTVLHQHSPSLIVEYRPIPPAEIA